MAKMKQRRRVNKQRISFRTRSFEQTVCAFERKNGSSVSEVIERAFDDDPAASGARSV